MIDITPQSYIKTNNPKGLPVYNRMSRVKLGGVVEEFSAWEYEEIIKCKKYPEYFIEKYIILDGEQGAEKFKLYDYQKDGIRTIKENPFSIILAPRRAGKSICILGYILWFVIFHSKKNVYVMSKTHTDSKSLLNKLKKMYESLPFFLQIGVERNYAVEKIELSNGSCIITATSKGVRGEDADLLYCVSGESKITIKDDDGTIQEMRIDQVKKIYNDKKYHIVYKTTNLVNNKIYVGYHGTDDLDDGYLGSGEYLKKAVKTYGKKNFKKEILYVYSNAVDAYNKEREIVDEDFILRDDTYNIYLGGGGYKGCNNFNKPRDKKFVNIQNGIVYESLLEAKKFFNTNSIYRECGNPNIPIEFEDSLDQEKANRVYEKYISCLSKSEEVRKKISESNKGKKCLNLFNKCPKKIKKTAEKHRGMKRTDEAKLKMSLAKKGMIAKNRKLSDQDIIKIREDYNNKVNINDIDHNKYLKKYRGNFCIYYAKIFNVSNTSIRKIIDNEIYKEIH